MILFAFLLVGLNGLFVAAEFSLIKVRKTRLAELAENGSPRAQTALDVTSQLDAYLSACQLGITLSSLGLGWVGEPAIATLIEPLFTGIAGWSTIYTHTISLVIAFSIITLLHIVLGELVPKSLAIQRSESTALATAGLLKGFYWICYPIIRALNGLANLVLRMLRIEPANEADLSHSEEELRMLVDASQKHGYLDKLEGKLLDNVFEFSDRNASEVMVPRQDMVCIFIQDTFEEVLEVVKKYGHTRYLLCDDDKDHVLGLVHMRDILRLQEQSGAKDIIQIKRDILAVPEGMPISHLVQRMRSLRTHIAVVVDEFGGSAGLVTIEDMLEELVGEIYDEFESEQPPIQKISENEYLLNGRVLMEEVSEMLDIQLEEETVTTIGGYIFSRLGRKPVKGDSVFFEGIQFEVIEVMGFRITQVKIVSKPLETKLSEE
ncbi:hemolysin family protein [Desulfosporosinus sp. BICA1-9]|uniref:hemolysin family protein n=1 Tax=Desulfosporosinus sp. BICA1-9 TaxID=1531958 RepID=UPI00054B1837|nr:hemolysin family protein [Desulfosporosinus sp. BICA1-9]KJS48829.1 MAG: membrane protein [Peptococcaceae bacterium BRH_c23]KJS87081.1 MAG: membrane protein [Desulfosporosinus sp. BICA1-9]HBW34171.1 HlyC/CorC family transporter [Desulfosporosinus sp.]